MANTRPTGTLPSWATTPTYPAGSDDWSGKASRVEPSAGKLAQGFTPNTNVPAEEINWLFGKLSDLVGYLDSWWNPPLVSSTLPQLRFKDAAGNGRWIVDHNGLPTGGRISQFSEEWASIISTGGAVAGWTVDSGAQPQNPSASYNARYIGLVAGEVPGVASEVYTAPLVWSKTPSMSLVLEFEFGLDAVSAGTTSNATWYLGLTAGTTMPDANSCMLVKPSGSNFFTGTSVSPTVGTYPTDRYRIEVQGSASPLGAYQALFWINDVLVSTLTAGALPGAAAAWRIWIGCVTAGGITGSVGYLGPVKMTWNRFASGPNL